MDSVASDDSPLRQLDCLERSRSSLNWRIETWKEQYLLELVAAVMKVEKRQRRHLSYGKSPQRKTEDKWFEVAAQMPLFIFQALKSPSISYKTFPIVCKRKFAEVCGHFNYMFSHFDRHSCLTTKLMTKLAHYSRTFPDQQYFFETGPRVKFIKLDSDDNSAEDKSASVNQIERVVRDPESSHNHLQLQHLTAASLESQLQLDLKHSRGRDDEFVKMMTYSQVVRGFILGLPAEFCAMHFARYEAQDLKRVAFVLIDSDKVEWRPVYYLPAKHCFSGGWGDFARKHNLKVDDILSFRLIRSRTFQVRVLLWHEGGRGSQALQV